MALTKVSSNLVADDAIVTGKIADGGVGTADLAANAVTTAKIAQNNVTAHHIADGSVTTTQLGADAVTAAKVADDAISEEHLDKTIISDMTAVTPVAGDFVLLGDTSDSNNLKKSALTLLLNSNVDLSTKLNLSGGTMTGDLLVKPSASGATATSGTVGTFESNDNTEVSILGGSSSVLALNFGHSGDNDDANINYNTTSGSEQMAFRVNASNRLIIDSTGKVAIGHTSAVSSSTLTLNGNQSALALSRNTGTDVTWTLSSDAENMYLSDDGNSSYNMMWKNNGNVSIGSIGCKATLDIKTTGNDWEDGLLLQHDNANTGWNIHPERADNALYFGYNSDTSQTLANQTATARMVIEGAGNVGIGVTDPDSKLEIKGSGGGTGLTFKTTDSSSNENFFITDGGGVGVRYYPFSIGVPSSTSIVSGTRMFIDGTSTDITVASTGYLGIGTTGPRAALDVRGGHSSSVNEAISFGRTDDDYRYNSIFSYNTSSTNSYLSFKIHDGGSSVAQTETMVIAPGKVGIGTTTPDDLLHVSKGDPSAAPHSLSIFNLEDDTDVAMMFLTPNTSQGQIRWADPQDDGDGYIIYSHSSRSMLFGAAAGTRMTINSNGVIDGDFNDTSDVALKENITNLTGGLSVIKQLQPRNFDWKDDNKNNGVAGFIAQEVATVLPKEVHGENYVATHEVDGKVEGTAGKSLNVTGIVAHLTKAVQELEARIATLEG